MNTSLSTKSFTSIFTTLTATLGLALGSAGCLVTTDPGTVVTTDPGPAPTPAIAQMTIDPGATMSSTPGEGVGLFVQYDLGGHWNVFTTCDTSISGAACDFDVIVTADPSVVIDNVQGVDLEANDSVALGTDGSVNLVTTTSYGDDGMSFDADPGATIEIDVLLDGATAERFVYAVSDGALLNGVPTNPVDFVPASP